MKQINAVITGVGGHVPDYILTNDEISRTVDITNEWIMGHIGIKERCTLNEEGFGTSYMARKAVKQLMQRTESHPDDIDLVIVATTTSDYRPPPTASTLCERTGLKNALASNVQAVHSGLLYVLETGVNFVRSGRYKKVIIVGADKMPLVIDYTDCATCPIFGDGVTTFLLEPTTDHLGIIDSVLRTDGKGLPFLYMKAGGLVRSPSYSAIDNHIHYLHQEGRTIFKYAIANMSGACKSTTERNQLTKDQTDRIVPHRANQRIINAVAQCLDMPLEKVMISIEHYGNISVGTLPLCTWDFEDKLKKGDNLIFTTFGTGFAWGAVYVKWGYDGNR